MHTCAYMKQEYPPLYLLFLLLILPALHGGAQDLLTSRQSSHNTFIYSISNEDAGRLHASIWNFEPSMINEPLDLYPVDSVYKKYLPVGHYLFITARGGDLVCELRSVNNIDLRILNNHRDLTIVLFDSTGTEISTPKVSIRRKKVPFDNAIKAYRIEKTTRKGMVSVSHQGHVSWFEVVRNGTGNAVTFSAKRISHTFPINHVISPFRYLYSSTRNIIEGGRIYPPGIYFRAKDLVTGNERRKPTTGYVAMNKPAFKPGDTVFLKAFTATQSGRPLHGKADIILSRGYPDPFRKKLADVDPYRAGAYQFEFVLRDSLKLRLDDTYTIEVIPARKRQPVYNTFKYEQYELTQNTYTVRAEQGDGSMPSVLFLKGTDSNNMPLYDIRAQIILLTDHVNTFLKDKVFVPDTLWTHHTPLDPIGETKVVIPDSVMPATNMRYTASVIFLNSENERVIEKKSLDQHGKRFPVKLKVANDSLILSPLSAHHKGEKFLLIGRDERGIFTKKEVTIPYQEKIRPVATSYAVHSSSDSLSILLAEVSADLEVSGNRTRDSLLVSIANPRNIVFRYFLFKNRRLILEGESTDLLIRERTDIHDHYSLSVQHVWAGESHTQDYDLGINRNHLTLQIEHPPLVHPGQSTTFTITATDINGNPVRDADITAYAITKKFKTNADPGVPSYRSPAKVRRKHNSFQLNTRLPHLQTLNRNLDYSFWKNRLGLDSITFYKFLFPDRTVYTHTVPSATTQLAPFVIWFGDIVTPIAIYIDDKPVYYAGTMGTAPYSFHVSPGKHTVRLRLPFVLITIPEVTIAENTKLILSVNRNTLPPHCTQQKASYHLTKEEQSQLARYFIPVDLPYSSPDAYLRQGDRFYLLPRSGRYSSPSELTGPFYPGSVDLIQSDGSAFRFSYQPDYRYSFANNQLKMRETNVAQSMSRVYLSLYRNKPSLRDEVLTEEKIKTMWSAATRTATFDAQRTTIRPPAEGRTGRLILEGSRSSIPGSIRASFAVNLDHPDRQYLFPKMISNEKLEEGRYEIVLFFHDERYIKIDSVSIIPYGTNYYNIESHAIHASDPFSRKVLEIIRSISDAPNQTTELKQQDLNQIRNLYLQQSSDQSVFSHTVSGMITDSGGEPLPGVNVIVKGTAIGTVTDARGYYSVRCPPDAVIVYSFVGFSTKDAQVRHQNQINISLQEDVAMLSEIVTAGYGSRRYRHTGSERENTIELTQVADSLTLAIRGSVAGVSTQSLVILDGVPVNLSDIDPGMITAVGFIKGHAATSLYGSRASGGVILLSAKKGATRAHLMEMATHPLPEIVVDEVPGNRLRKNFRDYAFWKPALRTDAEGKASFTATFPDDITGWRTLVLGIARRKATGMSTSNIQSYKPVVAQVSVPHFLVEGDEVMALGKITNYGTSPVKPERTIRVNEMPASADYVQIQNTFMDTIAISATRTDSLSVFYGITLDRYADAELRYIPVVRKGTKETSGSFLTLLSDTTFTIDTQWNSQNRNMIIHADVLDVLLNEVQYLKTYPYYCNEQLASRLTGLILEDQVRLFRNEKQRNKTEIERAIRRLVAAQNKKGGWGWWINSNSDIWVTLHVLRSLLLANSTGYNVPVNEKQAISFLEDTYDEHPKEVQTDIFIFLLDYGRKVHPEALTDTTYAASTVIARLKKELLIQLSGGNPDLAWIASTRSETIKGNYYWGEHRNDVRDNAFVNTSIAYRILENSDPNHPWLGRIRNFFLENRATHWRNTYESAIILKTILPALMRTPSRRGAPEVSITGGLTATIRQFPFVTSINDDRPITVTKTGLSPVYVSLFEEKWNANPVKSGNNFSVTTSFERGNVLSAGKPVALYVTVDVEKDAEYIMIEVPIPGGCSYAAKTQSSSNGEVHREYFADKTSIFCQRLGKGSYTYRIDLLPRFNGTYTLNPARAECMYFPVVFGHEDGKVITIRR
jgi:alpha-2-macroglobulin